MVLLAPTVTARQTLLEICHDELNFVDEFRYLGHVMTATIQEAKCSWQYAGSEVLICTYGGKNPIIQVTLFPNLWMLPNVWIVTHTNELLMSSDTPARVRHLR